VKELEDEMTESGVGMASAVARYARAISGGVQEHIEAEGFAGFWVGEPWAGRDYLLRAVPAVLAGLVDAKDMVDGIADVGGEVMRFAISAVGRGRADDAVRALAALHELEAGFALLPAGGGKGRSDKIRVLRESVMKVEQALAEKRVQTAEAALLVVHR
jgi:predicted translin family RNA/ssDNA-binding protein